MISLPLRPCGASQTGCGVSLAEVSVRGECLVLGVLGLEKSACISESLPESVRLISGVSPRGIRARRFVAARAQLSV